MEGNYFIVDGSSLTAQIRLLRRKDASFEGRKLCPKRMINYLTNSMNDLHHGEYKRITFYFPKGDETAIGEYLEMPDHAKPGEIRDMHFKFCGERLKKSKKFDKFVDENVPEEFLDRFTKSEKGIDIEICCDALKLAAAGRMERLFLMSNDRDFIPMCRTVKEYGSNVSIIQLTEYRSPSVDLLREADSFDVIPMDRLQQMFLPHLPPEAVQASPSDEPKSELALKADAAPADKVDDMAVVEEPAQAVEAEPEAAAETEADAEED